MSKGQKYIIVDERVKARKDLPELVKFKDYDIIVLDENARRQADENYTENVPIDEIFVNRELFQNRKKEYSEESVKRIIEAVGNGTFNIKVFDPVLLWRNPADGKLYILSGHSRTEAFRRLAETDSDFETIPAKILDIDEELAVSIARNSNTLSTKESDTERALYYQNLRIAGTPEKLIYEDVRKAEGKEANKIYKYSFLSPDGMTAEALRQLESGDVSSRAIVQSVAAWLGEARRKYPQLTESHENELFRYMTSGGGYGKGNGQVSSETEFIEKVNYLVQRQGVFFDATKPLNINNLKSKSDFMTDYESRLKQAEKELSDSKKTLESKRLEFSKRGANAADIEKALKPYSENITLSIRKLLNVKQEYGKYIDAERSQTALFGGGLGKPYMRLEFDQNEEMLRFAKLYREQKAAKEKEMKIKSTRAGSPRNKENLKELGLGGRDLSHLYPKSTGETVNYGMSSLNDTLRLIVELVKESKESITPLAMELRGKTLSETSRNIWDFIKENIRYVKDDPKIEQVRTSARILADGYGDCDCFTQFACSIFYALEYNPFFYVVAFNGNPESEHIYAGVADNIIDAVMPVYGKHPENITKTIIYTLDNKQRTFNTSPYNISEMIQLHALHGIEDNPYKNITRQTLQGIDANEIRKYKTLLRLSGADREIIADIMPGVAGIGNDGTFYMYSHELGAIADEISRLYFNRELNGLGELGRLRDKFKNAVKAVTNVTKDATKLAIKTVTAPTKLAIKTVTAPTKAIIEIAKDPRHTGLILKDSVKDAGQFVTKEVKEGKSDVVAVAKDTTELVKQATFAPIRAAWILLMKMNFLKQASHLYLGYLTPQEAQDKGLDMDEYKKAVTAKDKVESFWQKSGGDIETLKDAMTTGRGKKVAERSMNGLNGPELAAPVVVATPILTAVGAFFKQVDWKKLLSKAKDEALKAVENENTPDVLPPDNNPNPNPNPNPYTEQKGLPGWVLPTAGGVLAIGLILLITKK
jgi:hypothetical protein